MFIELHNKIAARLEKVGCPVCLNTRFSVVLRCDFSTGDGCMFVGECQHCGAKFDIQNVPTIEEMCSQAEHRFARQPCNCGGSTELQFLCELETEDCCFVAVCRACGSRRRIFPGSPEQRAHLRSMC